MSGEKKIERQNGELILTNLILKRYNFEKSIVGGQTWCEPGTQSLEPQCQAARERRIDIDSLPSAAQTI